MDVLANKLEQMVVDLFQSIEIETILIYGAYLLVASLVFSILKNILILLMRILGISSPTHYAKFPRLPWRSIYLIWLNIKIWHERVFLVGRQSTGGFAGVLAMLCLLYKPGMVYVGRGYAFGFGLNIPIGFHVQKHVSTVASTGAGKTVSAISRIAMWAGSVFMIDVKNDVWNALAHRDSRQWIKFSPYEKDSGCWNPFDDIKYFIETMGVAAGVVWAFRLAASLVIVPDGAKQPYFYEMAKNLIAGAVLYILSQEPEENHNLVRMRMLLQTGLQVFDETGKEITTPKESFDLWLRDMRNNSSFGGAVSGAASALLITSSETYGNVISTALEATKWIMIPDVQRVVRQTTIRPLRELKQCDDYVLAFTPPVYGIRLELAPLGRLLVNFIGFTFEAIEEGNGVTYCYVDETPNLGFIEVLPVMLPVARSHLLVIELVSQDIELLKKVYPKDWESFFGNSDLVTCLSTNSQSTAEYFCRVIGKKTIIEKDKASGRKLRRDVEAITPDQFKRHLSGDSENIFVIRNGKRTLQLKNIPHFRELPVWLRWPSIKHRENILHRFSRFLFDRKSPQAIGLETQDVQPTSEPVNELSDIEGVVSNSVPDNVIPFKPEDRHH